MPNPLPKLPRKPRPTRPPLSTSCEVPTAIGWRIISVEEALTTRAAGARCIECKQAVRPHATGTNGMAAHFEHLERNPSCSRSHQG